MRIEDFDPKIKEAVEFVISYIETSCDDWVTIKKEIMKSLPWQLRTNFSTRDRKTYEQRMNDFEKMIAEYWKQRTGVELKLIQLWERKDRKNDDGRPSSL